MKKFLILSAIIAAFLYVQLTNAQVSVNADIMSRYIWRGVDYGNSPSFQPALSFTAGGFAIGTWGAYSFAGTGSVFSEHDIWTQYTITTEAGAFSIIYTDYYYPSAGLEFFNYNGEGNGSHVLEAGLSYTGPASFPVSFSGFYNFHNDPDKSTYFQAGYPFVVDDITLSLFAGLSGSSSAWYGSKDAAFINVGLTASRSIPISESFSLPVSASFIINPEIEQSYLVFGFRL